MTLRSITAALTAAILAVGLTACNRDENAATGSSADQRKSSSPSGAASGSGSAPRTPGGASSGSGSK